MLSDLIATHGVEERLDLGSAVGVMALHGGLESETESVAGTAAARSGASLYAIVQPEDHRWHIPSARHDPRQSERMTRFFEHVRLVVSVHGFGRDELPDSVLLGGSNRRVAERLAGAMRARTSLDIIDDLDRIPSGLRGLHPANPVNLPEFGGVQVELSPGARTTEAIDGVIDAIAVVLGSEVASVCATG